LRNKYVDEQRNANCDVKNKQRPSSAKPEQLHFVAQLSPKQENCGKFPAKKQTVS